MSKNPKPTQNPSAKPGHLLAELSRADFVTLAAVLAIVNSFWLLWHGLTELAVALAFVSTFLDYLDGVVARRHGSSPYGKVLDSLYDVLGWVLFPALVVNIRTHWAWWSIVVTTIFCLFAILRLGRFTIGGYEESVAPNKLHYTGLPVLFSKYALLLAFVANGALAVATLAIMTPLMVSNRRIPKPHKITAQIELIYALIFVWLYFYHG